MNKHGTAQRFQQRYKITVAEYEEMCQKQDGKCFICHKPPTGSKHNAKLHVDHDHKTGQTRALLCHFCNHGLGNFKDDPQSLERAAQYVRSHTNGERPNT
jgi:hypothetical protein